MPGRVRRVFAPFTLGVVLAATGWAVVNAGQPAAGNPAAVRQTASPAGRSAPRAAQDVAMDERLKAASGTRTIRVGVALPDGKVRVDTLPLEDYVSRVISGEGQPRAAAAAHEALAIVIRTFALANRHRHRAEGYDLCDSTHCQVMRPALPVARAAALATSGRVLLDKGQPAFVYYSALCGGIPALASEVWPGAVDYAPGAPHDDACADEPGWMSELTARQVEVALRAAGLAGRRLKSLSVEARTPSDRAGRLRVEGFSPDAISAYEFRMAVGRTQGWQLVRSTSFDVTRTESGYQFRGVGYGHGVGLCVIGAGRRAARGESATDILRAYFGELAESTIPGPTATAASRGPRIGAPPQVARSPAPQIGAPPAPLPSRPLIVAAPPGAPSATAPASGGAAAAPVPPIAPTARDAADIVVTLPAGEERDRALLAGIVRSTRDGVATRAGLTSVAPIAVTVHQTVEAFGRATGQPWWVPASTVETAIDLLPLGELRRRGVLESTLRAAVARAVLDSHLRNRPAWVRAGAAAYFSALPPAAPTAGARVRCPSDAELLRPISGGAEREALSRADRCFQRQIAQGRSWQDVR